MEISKIDSRIEVINRGLEWGDEFIRVVDEAEGNEFHRRLVEIKNEVEKIRYAISERCAAATFGESQMGKSYLVNAMFSDPSKPLKVYDNSGVPYDFKTEINPSQPNAQIEATGVVTRFTGRRIVLPEGVPSNYLSAQLLTVTDIVLILSESYFNEVDFEPRDSIEWADDLRRKINETKIGGSQNIIRDVDILNIEEYFRSTQLSKKSGPILSSEVGYFQFLLKHINEISEVELMNLLKELWCENQHISILFEKLMDYYRKLKFCSVVYIDFKSILKKHGTLVDVARLDEMFTGKPLVYGPEFESTTNVYVPSIGQIVESEKSFLSALVAELTLNISIDEHDVNRRFFEKLDILDFPGACPDAQIKVGQLFAPNKISYVYRRGKVSYLFKKYSSSRRISTLLFCHNNHQQKYETMYRELQIWIENNVGGKLPKDREEYIRNVGVSPFFIVATWFNTDLQYDGKKKGEDLNYLWQRRFNQVLCSGVLKFNDDSEDHWFNHWTESMPNFQNIFMLRDFDHSKMIFSGYDRDEQKSEVGVNTESYLKYPDFLDDLRVSFINNDFVRKHFGNPLKSWEESATPTNDGTLPIMRALNRLAPNITEAREIFFEKELDKQLRELCQILENHYESSDAMENIKRAKRLAGRVNRTIESLCGEDTFFFSRMLDNLMLSEPALYEIVFEQLNGQQQASTPLTDKEAQICMRAKLERNYSREKKIELLCAFLGCDDEEECKESLAEDGIDLAVLLGKDQMLVSSAEQLVNYVEGYWYNTFLMNYGVNMFKDKLPLIGDVFQNIFALYNSLKVHDIILSNVNSYLSKLNADVQCRIISDYISMELNHFVMCYGYDYYSSDLLNELERSSADKGLNIDWQLLYHMRTLSGLELLAQMGEIMDELSVHGGYESGVYEKQLELPQYRNRWQWEERLKLSMLLMSGIPNPRYGVVANDKLGQIIQQLKK